jgi:hypothetical protein
MQTQQLYDLLKLAQSAERQINCLLMTPQQSVLRETVLHMCELITQGVTEFERRENEQERLRLPVTAPIIEPQPGETVEGGENVTA